MALIDMKHIVKDYKMGETMVHALRDIDVAVETASSFPSSAPRAPASRP